MNLLSVFPPLAAVFVFSLVVGSAGLLLCTAVRRRGPATQHSLLRFTLILLAIGALLAPFAGRFAPEWARKPIPVSHASAAVTPTSSLESPSLPTLNTVPSAKAASRQGSTPAPSLQPTTPTDLRPAVVVLWLAGTGIAGILLLGGSLALYRIRKGSTALTLDADLAERVRPLFPALRIRLLSSEISPFQAGLLKPCIYLPKSLLDGAPQDLQVALLHEASHAARQDCAWRGFGLLLRGLLWPNPAVWLLVRRLCWTAEAACDDAVVAQMADQESYSRSLLHLAERFGATGRQSLAPGILGYPANPPSLLRRRVERLLSPRYSHSQKENSMSPLIYRLCAGSLLLCAAAGIYGAGAVNPAPARPSGVSHSIVPPALPNGSPTVMTVILKDSTAKASELKGASALVQDSDVNRVLDELWKAGAVSASLQGKTVKRTSKVRAKGPNLTLDGATIRVPVTIVSHGDSGKLAALIDDPKSHLHEMTTMRPPKATALLGVQQSAAPSGALPSRGDAEVEISPLQPVASTVGADEQQEKRIRDLEAQNRALMDRIQELEKALADHRDAGNANRERARLAQALADQNQAVQDQEMAIARLRKAQRDAALGRNQRLATKERDTALALLARAQNDAARRQDLLAVKRAKDQDAARSLLKRANDQEAARALLSRKQLDADLQANLLSRQIQIKQLEARLMGAEAKINENDSRIAGAQAEMNRLAQLVDKGLASVSELEKAKAKIQELMATRNVLQSELEVIKLEMQAQKARLDKGK